MSGSTPEKRIHRKHIDIPIEPLLIPLDAEEIAVLKIVLLEAHRYGTLRASNPALRRLQARFAQLADKRVERAMKRGSHRV